MGFAKEGYKKVVDDLRDVEFMFKR